LSPLVIGDQTQLLNTTASKAAMNSHRTLSPASTATRFRRIGMAVAAGIILASGPAAVFGQVSPAHITGVAHMAYHVTNLKQARDYYEGFLGFQEAFTIRNADGSDRIVFLKINDRQFIELYVEPFQNYGFIHDAGFETNDAKGMRDHLASIGIKVPESVTKDEAGNLSFSVIDPSGFTLEVVQYLPGSMTGRSTGKFMPIGRIADHIDHVGLLVKDREVSWKWYHDAFDFTKEGDGSKMAVPDSPDRFELGVEKRAPLEPRFHIKDHICLGSPDVPTMTARLRAEPAIREFPKAIADTHQLESGKNVVEIYDLDGNRVEVMEPLKSK
jgi:catechol 2,3-dioxygenase-like lactoylglutathione lyase family enzyme